MAHRHHPVRSLCTAVTALVVACFALLGASDAFAGAIISNGTVKLGVNDTGELNFTDPNTAEFRGVTFVPTDNDGTRAGCLCEGWGVANVDPDPALTFSGKANRDQPVLPPNVTPVSFTSTPSTATSVTTVAGRLRVTHEFRPFEGTPNLYEVFVTLENIGSQPLADVRYTRLMDWDVEPTAFTEFVTIRRGSASNLLYSSADGFADNDPLGVRDPIVNGVDPATQNVDLTHFGPFDHGALFDFGFGALAVGETTSFSIFYGAAATEAEADAAVSAAGAEVFSYGQPQTPAGTLDDTINTFIFGFRAVGGAPPIPPVLTLTPGTATRVAGEPHTLTAHLADSAGGPVPNSSIVFDVNGANDQAPATRTTGEDGNASFTYTGTSPGADDIVSCFDTDGDGVCSDTEVTARAAATYEAVAPPAPPTITSGVVQGAIATFTFTSEVGGATFECRVDAAEFAPCTSPFTTGFLAAGPHTFDVRVRDAAGTAGVPARQTFAAAPVGGSSATDRDGDGIPDTVDNCPDIANPDQPDKDKDRIGDVCDRSDASGPPVLGQTVIATVVSGEVFVRLPAGAKPRTNARAAQVPAGTPAGYTPLKGAEVLPVGTVVHAVRGRLSLTAASGAIKKGITPTQKSDFYSGIFQIRQKKAKKPITDLTLRSPDFSKVCGASTRSVTAGPAAAKKKKSSSSKKVASQLFGDGKGAFRTSGRHSAATVRGTKWLTQERCDGTLTKVTQGVVRVFDKNTKKTVTVRAGGSYLARAVRATVKTSKKKTP